MDRRIATLIKESNDNPLLKKALKAPFKTNLLKSIIYRGEVRALLFKLQTLKALNKLFVTNIFSKAAAEKAAERNKYSIRDTKVLININYLAIYPQAIIKLNKDRKVRALINSGAEVNIISKKVAIKLGLAITEEYRMYIIDVNENVSKTRGLYKNIRISIKRVSTTQCFLVIANPSKPLILKMPFTQATKLRSESKKNKKVQCVVTDPVSQVSVAFQSNKKKGAKHRYLSFLYPNSEF